MVSFEGRLGGIYMEPKILVGARDYVLLISLIGTRD